MHFVVTILEVLSSLDSFSVLQEFKRLLVTGRLLEENTDVQHYQVDGITYLARTVQKAL